MGVHVDKAACIGGPIIAADATGLTGVSGYAAATTTQTITLPTPANPVSTKKSTVGSRFMRVQAIGCNVQFGQVIDGSSPTLVYGQASAANLGGHVSRGGTVQLGTTYEFIVDPRATKIVWIADNTTGQVEFHLAETPGNA